MIKNIMEIIRKILKFLRVTQTISNEERQKNGLEKLGRGYFEANRLNPYNPLSYILIIIVIIIGMLMYGFVGFFEETKNYNPFKWD
jgi:hypothetical protein